MSLALRTTSWQVLDLDSRKEEQLRTVQSSDPGSDSIEFLKDVGLQVSLEMGLAQVTIGDFLKWKPGTVIILNKREDESLDFRVNGRLAARGEPVVVNEKYGVRITSVVDPENSSESA